MSFKSEVREFISKQKTKDDIIDILKDEIHRLREQNKDIMDRLMAKNFQELKVYESPIEYQPIIEEIKPEEDYQNAGEIL